MKKLGMFLLLCSLLTISAHAGTSSSRADRVKNKRVSTITRDKQNPLVLLFLGRPYSLFKSQPGDASNEWNNLYLPAKDQSADNAILIRKIENTTCSHELDETDTNDDELITMDSRNPNDQIVSGMPQEDDVVKYVVARFIQEGNDVYSVFVSFPRTEQTDEEWQQLQRLIFREVRNTPRSVFIQDFVQSACKFGEDCY